MAIRDFYRPYLKNVSHRGPATYLNPRVPLLPPLLSSCFSWLRLLGWYCIYRPYTRYTRETLNFSGVSTCPALHSMPMQVPANSCATNPYRKASPWWWVNATDRNTRSPPQTRSPPPNPAWALPLSFLHPSPREAELGDRLGPLPRIPAPGACLSPLALGANLQWDASGAPRLRAEVLP